MILYKDSLILMAKENVIIHAENAVDCLQSLLVAVIVKVFLGTRYWPDISAGGT